MLQINKALSAVAMALALAGTGAQGDELNPMGGIIAGNAEGTIPPWEGGLPQQTLTGERVSDPFPEDKPLFTINAENLAQHAHQLSTGQQAMLRKYPQSFVLPVYPSRRSASYPEFVYEALRTNRDNATLVEKDKRSGVDGSRITSPFPEPKTGLEAIWNHIMRWRGVLLERNTSWIPVTARGNYRPILLVEEVAFPYASPRYNTSSDSSENIGGEIPEFRRAMIAIKQKFVSPGSMAGRGALTYETYDYTRYERIRWLYSPQLKRVVRLPRAPLDQPLPATEGIAALDDSDMYVGSPELFDWELNGRRELLVPYNSYRLKDGNLKFKDLISEHHLNQEYTRYELHRVWEVTATARGKNARFGKRVFYLDEDTWQIVLSEKYTRDGELAMYAEAHTVNYVQVPVVFTAAMVHYQLSDGRFLVRDLNNEMSPHQWFDDINPRNFSPNALLDYLR